MPHRMIRRSTLVEQPPYLPKPNQTEYGTSSFHGQYQRASIAPTRSFSASEVEVSPSEVIGSAHGLNIPSYPNFDTQSPYFDSRSEISPYLPRPITSSSSKDTESPYFDPGSDTSIYPSGLNASSSSKIDQSLYFDPRTTYPSTATSSVDETYQLPSTWSAHSGIPYTLQSTSYHYNPHPLPLSPFDTSIPLPTWSSSIPYSDWPALPSPPKPSINAPVSLVSVQGKPPSTSSFGLHPSYSTHSSQTSIPPFGLDVPPSHHNLYLSRSESSSGSGFTGLLFSPMGEIKEASASAPIAPIFDHSQIYTAPPLPSYPSHPFPQTPFYPTSTTSTQSSPHSTTPVSDRPKFDCPKFELNDEGPIKRGRKPKSEAGSGESAQEWDHITDRTERRRIQNKLAQRIYRARHQKLGRKR